MFFRYVLKRTILFSSLSLYSFAGFGDENSPYSSMPNMSSPYISMEIYQLSSESKSFSSIQQRTDPRVRMLDELVSATAPSNLQNSLEKALAYEQENIQGAKLLVARIYGKMTLDDSLRVGIENRNCSEQSFRRYTELNEEGCPEAAYALAMIYQKAKGIYKHSKEEIITLYKKAAAGGISEAADELRKMKVKWPEESPAEKEFFTLNTIEDTASMHLLNENKKAIKKNRSCKLFWW